MKEKKKMLKRQDLINDILDVYDYIDVLEMENEKLQNAVPKIRSAEKNVSSLDEIMIEQGKKDIFKWSTISWNKVNCSYDEEANTYNFTSFDNWLDKKIDCDRMPSAMSFNDFATYFKTELLDLYKKEKEEALKEAKENE